MRDKTRMEAIRALVYNQPGFYDVYFNDRGILQIEPLSKTDWENTGLVLSAGGYYDRKFKFSTTNAITNVSVTSTGKDVGVSVESKDVIGLDLSAFFGNISASTPNPNNANKNTSKATTNTKSKAKTSTTSNKYGNPFNNRPKKVWINADGGTDSFKKSFIKLL